MYSIKLLIKEILNSDINTLKKKYRNVKNLKNLNTNVNLKPATLKEVLYLHKLSNTEYTLYYLLEYREKQLHTNEDIYKYTLKEVEFNILDGKNNIVKIELLNNNGIKYIKHFKKIIDRY